MKRLPIHDETVPIACTAGVDDLPLRKEQLRRLRAFDPTVERTDVAALLDASLVLRR